ncbi:MAG: hypothetical protein IJ795_06490 [Bacteroidales bacterium]|nr:hypothetical protein [Bacteroidales bacterium]
MKGIDIKVFLMDAGSFEWNFEGTFGTALGQLGAELRECGKVLKSTELSEGDLPASADPCDFIVLRRTLLRRGYVTVRLEESCGRYLVTLQASARNLSSEIVRDIKARLS